MKKLIGIFSIFAILSSCSPTKKIVSVENYLQQAYDSQQYAKVLNSYNQLTIIGKNKELSISPSNTLMAAISAYHLEDYETASHLFSEIKEKDESSIYMEGMSYQKLPNPQLEYNYWKENIDLLEESNNYQEVLQRLYLLEVDYSQYAAADVLWGKLDNTNDEEFMSTQLVVLENLEKNKEALALSNSILEQNDENETALLYKGKFYFERAEKLYQSEMTKYNRDPNYTTYAYLKRELKKVSADFRVARGVFEKLHNLSPENRTYISYLKNCYVRLEMKTEAAKMDRLLN